MFRVIVATNPADDPATKMLSFWHKQVVTLAKEQKDIKVFELTREKTNKQNLTELIEKNNPHLVILNGHGSNDSVFGFSQNILIRCGENEILLKEKIIHALSCNSGKELGPQCVKVGAKAFIGYKEEFKMMYLKENDNDEFAKLFLGPAFEVVFSLIRGFSVQKAFNNSQRKYLENLKLVIMENKPVFNVAVAPLLYHDLIHQVCLGDGSASF